MSRGADPPRSRQIKKIWVAMSTPFQANFFAPLIEQLQGEYDFFVTAREHDGITSILKAKKINYVPAGKHGGRLLENKLVAYAQTIQQILPMVEKEKPDLLLTERWPEAVRVAFGLNIPSWAIFYDEREKHVNQMVFPLATKVFVPRFYTFQELYQHGVTDLDKIIWFNGFHTGYLKDTPTNGDNPYKKIGLDSRIVFVRPEPEFASFFPNSQPILEKAVDKIVKNSDCNIAVLPRTEKQRMHYSRLDKRVTVIDHSFHDSPVMHANVALGAAETMLMEAFVLGKPAVSAIYWEPSKPVTELHRYIPHSTDPEQIASYVDEYLDEEKENEFKERASLIVKAMDNPVKLMIDEIRRIDEVQQEDVVLKRRSKMEIRIDIIQASSLRPLRPTHIMKAANISYNELKIIIDDLERRGLLRVEATPGGKYYQATNDGLRLLEDYKRFRNTLFD